MTSRKSISLPTESRGQMGSAENDIRRRYPNACRAIAEGAGCPPLLDKIATDVLPRIISALDADGGVICFLDEQGACRELFAHFGLPPDSVTAFSSLDLVSLVGPGSSVGPSALQTDAGGVAKDLGFVSIILVPLRADGEQTDVLLLGSHQARAWEGYELLFEALGIQLASSLTIARLYERCQREEAQLRAMSSVALSVGRADLDEILNAALAAALELANLETGAVLLLDERSKSVGVRVAQGPGAELALSVPPVSTEDGLTGRAVRSGEIQVSEDVPSDDRVAFEILRKAGYRTLVVIPLTGRDHVVGTMNLGARESLQFDSEDLAALQTIGNHMGMVIENATLHVQTKQRLEHLSAVHETALDIVGRLDIAELLHAILERATKLLHAKGGGLFLYHPEKAKMEMVASHQLSRDYTGLSFGEGEGACGRAVLTGEPVVVSHYPSYAHRVLALTGDPPKSVVAVPFKAGETILGAVTLVDNAEERTFDDEDVRALQLFAAHAALALGNARIYAEIKRQVEESQVLLKVARAIAATSKLQELLDLIVQSAVETIPSAEAGAIHLLDPEAEELTLRAVCYRPGALPLSPGAGAMKVGQGIAGHAIREGRVMNIPDVDRDPRFIRFPGSRPFKSLLVAPLMLATQRLGTLSVHSETDHAFGADDERLMTLLSAQASMAIGNASLHEETVRRSDELRQAYGEVREMAKMKDEFVARISHELKSPLAPMSIAVERTLSEACGPLNSVQRELLEIASVNIDRLSAAITELLDVVRLSAGTEEGVRQTFDLRLEAEKSVSAMRPSAKAQDIRVREEIPDTPVLVLANRRKMGQVISNLLSNALRFNRPSGEVRLCIGQLDDEWAEVSVADTGIGIPEEAFDSLFTRFFQVESSLTRTRGGLGLGLAIVKEYVELDGGTIRVESEEGKGSTFTFTVPLA